MILNQLLSVSLRELTKLVVLACKFTLKGIEGLLSSLLDSVALLAGDARSERVGGKVATDSNAGATDHLRVLFIEGRHVQLGVIHVADVFGVFSVTMVSIDDLIKERGKLVVA